MTREELEKLSRLEQLGLLTAGLSHDFNNGALCMLAELGTIEARLGELRRLVVAALGTRNELPSRLLDDCERSLHVIDEGLQVAVSNSREMQRLHRGEIRPVNPAGTDLRKAAQRALRLVSSRLRPMAEVREAEPIRVAVSEDVLVRVLLNLLMNASDAFPEGSAQPRVRLQISSVGAQAVCDVIDNGPGVAPEVLPRLFQPFTTTKTEGSGTGLGLAVSRELVRAAGGELDLLETSPAGTTFRLVLPVPGTTHASGDEPAGATMIATALTPGKEDARPLARGRRPRPQGPHLAARTVALRPRMLPSSD